MASIQSRLTSWLRPQRPSAPRRPMLNIEQLEDRLTPSGYVPKSYFFTDTAQVANPSASPLAIAQNYLNAHAANFGLSTGDLAQALVTNQYTDAKTGITHIYFRQTVNGLEVENANINISVLKNGRVLTAGGGFVPGLRALIGAGTPTPTRTAQQAVLDAAAAIGIAAPGAVGLKSPSTGRDYSTVLTAPNISLDDITAKLQYVPTADGSAVLSWALIIRTTDNDHWYDMSIRDSNGAMVSQADWIDSASYRVVPNPNAAPDDGGFAVLTDPENLSASPFGWHDTDGIFGAEFTDTRGNNVDAHLDENANNVPDADEGGGARPNGGAGLDFSGFTFNAATAPTTTQNQNASQLNLFYANNFIHDVSYAYGFTEAAGNFQENNYGKGGLGSDSVVADAQDGSGTDNANFGTPRDGLNPRMQQFLFTSTTPQRDSSLDNSIVYHEYGHGISNRLTGGPANSGALSALQSGGMGEGWSDFFALMLLQRPTDTPDTSSGIATYAVGQLQTQGGVRDFPYSFNMANNPLTFEAYGTTGTTSYGVTRDVEEHFSGTLWASALWDMNWLLINKYGYDANLNTGWTAGESGNKLALALVIEAMKLQPALPSFIDARDAILAADIALTGGVNQAEIWQAFARRGLGVNASTPDSDSDVVVPDFTVPVAMSLAPDSVTVVEGDSGQQFITFSVTLEAITTNTVTVKYGTFNGGATAGSDYAGAFGTLTFAPGTLTQSFTVAVNGDTAFEQNENFYVRIFSPTKGFILPGTNIATVLIVNDDAPPPKPDVKISAVATNGGVVAEVRAINPANGLVRWSTNPFDGFNGAISIAVGDVNFDGYEDVIVGAGAGAGPRVVVLSGVDGSEIASFFAFSQSFAGGVNVAAADFNGDGYADIVVGTALGSSHVKVFDGRSQAEIRSFLAFGADFNAGVRIAAGDANGDGTPDIFLAGGENSTPVFRIFDGNTSTLLREGMVFAPDYAGGLSIAAADVDGDGFADAILGSGTASNPHVKVYSGVNGAELASFFVNEDFSPDAYATVPLEFGISVAAEDLDGDGINEILTTRGRGSKSILRAFRIARRDSASNSIPMVLTQVTSVNVFPGYFGGVIVASKPGA